MSNDPDQFHKKAKALVVETFNNNFPIDQITRPATVEDFYVTWFAKVLGNWKAMVSTDLLPGQYWEVTYDYIKRQTYVDHYDKVSNTAIPDSVYADIKNGTKKLVCPECRDGKLANCVGVALDPESDEFVACATTATTMQL